MKNDLPVNLDQYECEKAKLFVIKTIRSKNKTDIHVTYGLNLHLLLVAVIKTCVVKFRTSSLSLKATPAHLYSMQAALSLKLAGVIDMSGTGPISTVPYKVDSSIAVEELLW